MSLRTPNAALFFAVCCSCFALIHFTNALLGPRRSGMDATTEGSKVCWRTNRSEGAVSVLLINDDDNEDDNNEDEDEDKQLTTTTTMTG